MCAKHPSVKEALQVIMQAHPELAEYHLVLAINPTDQGDSYVVQVLDLTTSLIIVTEYIR